MRTRNDMKTITAHKNNTRNARRASSAPPWGKRISNIESEVRTVMGGISKNGLTRMALMAVLALVMVFTVGTAEAAFDQLDNDWGGQTYPTQLTDALVGSNWTPTAGLSWCVNQGSTPSTGPGPTAGNPDPYIYHEASGSNTDACRNGFALGDTIQIESGPFDAGANIITFDFDYNFTLNGDTGACVHLDVFNGSTWDLSVTDGGSGHTDASDGNSPAIFCGDTGGAATWRGPGYPNTEQAIDLDALGYNSGSITLRLRVTNDGTGSSFSYDVAFDNLHVVGVTRCSDGSPTSAIIPGSQTVGGSSVDLTSLYTMDPGGNGSVTGYTLDWGGGPLTRTSPWDSTEVTGSDAAPVATTFCVQYSDPDCGGTTGSDCNTITVDNTCSATAPGDLADTAVTASNVDLQWTADCANNNEYTVYRDGAAVSVCQNIACSAGTMTCSDTTVSQNTSYAYTVRGYNTAQTCESGDSNTVNVTTLSDPYKIGGCGGCHNSPPDDGARDGATGAVVGSHTVAQHTGGACSDCHVQPATNDHRNGDIQMAAPIHGQGTSYYDKNKSGTHTAADDVFAQVNAPALGNCTSTYCHSIGTSVVTGTIPSNTSPDWGGSSTCESCHGVGGGDDGRPNYANGTPKRNTHGDGASYGVTHKAQSCGTCHVGVSGSAGSYTMDPATHANGAYNLQGSLGYNQGTGACSTPGCHGGATWGGSLACTDCHNGVLSAPNASTASGGTVTTRPDVVSQFGLAWGHKNNKRNTVAPADCIVCHLEGDYATQGKSATYHGDGYIDLRNPDGTGEERITDNVGGAFSFVRYSVSYNAGDRTTTLGNTIAEVVTVKFCMACHDNNGATNTTARSDNGGTGTAEMPFGGVPLGGTYTATNGAIGTEGLVDVATQFDQNNSSRHPVGAPNNRAYPYSSRLADPYKYGTARDGNTTGATGTRTTADSVVMVCDDCHTSGTSLTNGTVTAHGTDTPFRGTYWQASTTQMCTECHIAGSTTYGYPGNSGAQYGTHDIGSGFAMIGGATNGGDARRPANALPRCNYCHFSNPNQYNEANRPRYAQDIHGFNEIYGTTGGWTVGLANGMRPVAFLRNSGNEGGSWANTFSPRPYSAPGITAGNASCGGNFAFQSGDSGISCSSNNHSNYTPSGTY